jgi:hypothetical protein
VSDIRKAFRTLAETALIPVVLLVYAIQHVLGLPLGKGKQ